MSESRKQQRADADLVTPLPFALTDRTGRVLMISERVAELVDGCPTLAIEDGMLVSSDLDEKTALSRLPRCESDCMMVAGADALPLFLTAQSMGDRILIVFARMEPPHARLGHALQSAFGLTAHESCIATALLEGCSLTEVARRMSVELSTARTHLKNIFAKTRTSRQTQLIRLLSTLSYVLHAGEEVFRVLPRMGDARLRKQG